jgi:hypothetical protein
VHEHCVVHGLDQMLKQVLTVHQARAALFEVFEQLVDGGAQLAQRLGIALEPDASGGAGFVRELPHLLRELVDGAFLPAFAHEEHDQSHGQNGRGQEPQSDGRQDQRGPR